MALLDLLGRRWALRVLWELRDASASFRELRDRCGGVSPSVLNTRVAELRDAGLLLDRPGEGYALTKTGRELLQALAPLQGFATRWARRSGSA